jgi:multiple sugar transport system substrate-binding protein
MNRRWRVGMIVGAVLVVGAIVWGVSAVGGDDSGGNANSAASSGKQVTLTIMEHQPPRVALLKKMLPSFEQSHPNIKVKLQEGPATDTDFQTKLTLAFNSGNAPDVVALPSSPADAAGSGYLLDLTPMVDKWPDWSHFYSKLRDGEKQPDGKVYTVPREATVQQLFYRKDVFDKAGISTQQPQTWQELIDRLQQAKRALDGPSIVFPAGKAWGGGSFGEGFINLMLGTGSSLYDGSSKKWVVRSPGITRSFGFYVDLTKSGVLDVPPLLNPEPWVATKYQAFSKGKLAVSTGGTWSWFFDWGKKGAGPIPNVFEKLGVWNYPTPDGGTYVVGGTGWRWAISSKTKHPNEAWELVKWLASPEFIAQNAVTIGAVSPRDDVHVAPYNKYPVLLDSEKQLPKARAFQTQAGNDQISQAVADVTEQIITGKVTTGDAAADAFAKQATQLLGDDKVEQGGT